MGSISNALDAVLQGNASASAVQASRQPALSKPSADGFGNAANVTLSPSAQAAVSEQGGAPAATGGAASNGNASASSPNGSTKGSIRAPIGISTAATADTTLLVEEAKQKVIPRVGVAGASEVVDSKGNIDYVKLDQLLAQQAIPKPAA